MRQAKFSISQGHIGPPILEKLQTYTLTRVTLLYPLCYEIPCNIDFILHRWKYKQQSFAKFSFYNVLTLMSNKMCLKYFFFGKNFQKLSPTQGRQKKRQNWTKLSLLSKSMTGSTEFFIVKYIEAIAEIVNKRKGTVVF